VTAAITARPKSGPWHASWLSWSLPGSGICIAAFGLLIAAAWYAHWPALIRVGPQLPAMKLNAALCFALCGASVVLVSAGRRRTARLFAAVAGAIAVATLVEYASGRDLFVDQLLISDYLTPANSFPGRMSPLTAACFLFGTTGLALSAVNSVKPWHLASAGVLACLVVMIAAFAFGGFLAGIEAAYGWYAYTRMALHTALGLLALSLALLAWVWEVSDRHQINVARWLPLAGAVTLMAIVALLAVVSLRELRNSYQARKTSYEALVAAQSLLGDLTDTMRGMSAYVMTGQAQQLESYQRGAQAVPTALAALTTLTRNDDAQQGLDKPLAQDLSRMIDYSRRVIALRDTQGQQAAIALISTGEGQVLVKRARDSLQALTDEVHRQMLTRDIDAERNYRHTVALLVLASVVAALLLVFAQIAVSRESKRRRRIDAKLQQLSAFQAAILDSANYAITTTGLDGVLTSFNATAERWLGYASADVVGKADPSLWHDGEEMRVRAAEMAIVLGIAPTDKMGAFATYLSGGNRYEDEWIFRRRDGSRFPVWLSMAALNDSGGHTIGYLGVFEDITKRKRQDGELRLSEERFRRAFDDAPIGMALVNPVTGRWLQVNGALCEMLGYSEQQMLEKNQQGITHADDIGKDQALVADVLSGKLASYRVEMRLLRRSGEVVHVDESVSLVRGPEDVPLYFVSHFEDITQRQEIDRLKGDFIATVSHELRTPLTSIRGSLGLIAAGAMGALPEKVAPMVKIALQNCERLVLIINDILDIEKIEAGKSQLLIGRVGVAALLKQAQAMNQAYADKFDVTLILEAPSAELEVLADADRLMQVITNLLSNASKFSPPGSSVRLRALPDSVQVRFEVEDDGSGIPEEFRGRIFQKFAQAESSAGRHFGGTGLGLAISRSLIEQMGGRIHFESRRGGGTIFFVELPRAGTESASVPVVQPTETARVRTLVMAIDAAQAAEPGAGMRLLHVENDPDLRTVLQASLAGQVEVVGAGTLKAAERLLQDHVYSAVVIDPGLPDGDGLSLLDVIDRMAVPLPVVILSVTEMPGVIRQRVAAAFVKSRVSEFDVAETIMALIHDHTARTGTIHLEA